MAGSNVTVPVKEQKVLQNKIKSDPALKIRVMSQVSNGIHFMQHIMVHIITCVITYSYNNNKVYFSYASQYIHLNILPNIPYL